MGSHIQFCSETLGSAGRGSSGSLCCVCVWLGDFSPWHLQGATLQSLLPPSHSSSPVTTTAAASPCTLLTGAARHNQMQEMGSPSRQQLFNGMTMRVTLGHLQLNSIISMKNISIYSDMQERFIKVCYNLQASCLLLNISSSFHSTRIICNYLFNHPFCSSYMGSDWEKELPPMN